MFKKIPIAAVKLPILKIFACLSEGRNALEAAKKRISELVEKKYVVFMNSGLSCFYSLLMVLKESSDKTEVVLPAYTAGSLIVAVKKAGLKPVLCDINMFDFNMDHDQLEKVVSGRTLCIVGVHMFGVIDAKINNLKSKYPDCFIVEDACQSLGGRIDACLISKSADISLFSFNKGKNLSTFGGGCIATDNRELAYKLSQKASKQKTAGHLTNMKYFIKMLILSIVINPWVYGMFFPLISRFKDTKPPQDIWVKDYSELQAAAALRQLENVKSWAKKRYDNGMRFVEGLKNQEGLILPVIPANTNPAFNRMPIVFKDIVRKEKAEKLLCKHGFETSRMYFKPLHQMFDIGYKQDDFPNAVYFAKHLLTVPCHSMLSDNDIKKIISIIKTSP